MSFKPFCGNPFLRFLAPSFYNIVIIWWKLVFPWKRQHGLVMICSMSIAHPILRWASLVSVSEQLFGPCRRILIFVNRGTPRLLKAMLFHLFLHTCHISLCKEGFYLKPLRNMFRLSLTSFYNIVVIWGKLMHGAPWKSQCYSLFINVFSLSLL